MNATTGLPQLFTLANAFKEGDLLVGGTTDDRVRDAARRQLLATRIVDIRRATFIDDGITDALERSRDRSHDADLDGLTIAQLKARLLGSNAAAWAHVHSHALASEAIAALAKVMTNDELSSVACHLFNPLPGDGVRLGDAQHFGSRIQPNSPGDDEEEILFSILEGLSHGCGDVIIGLNPATDELDAIVRLEQLLERVVQRLALPTRYCVLSDMVKQREGQRRARVDVGFQSLAGTSKALIGMVGLDVDALGDLARNFDGLYFETGQGSAVTNGTAEGIDMVTLESRAYGVARHIRRQVSGAGQPRWMIVNDVAGFIGPEVFRTTEQLERACLEDTVMAKLHGLTMGLDVCATFHMGISPSDLRTVASRVVEAACPAYLMAVAGNADPMLGYLTTSFREHPQLRSTVRRQITSAMDRRLHELAAYDERTERVTSAERVAGLYAQYVKGGGDRRTTETLAQEGMRSVQRLQERGFDLGVLDVAQANARVDRIYTHARSALYAAIDESVLRDVSDRVARARTIAATRDEYLAHPAAGECLREEDARALRRLYAARTPQVQLIISDGLNANAVNEQLRALLPPLRKLLTDAQCHVGEVDIVVQNGRVRVGYEIGALTDANVVIHLIGERPGTGLNTLSAYLTYGRDRAGQARWSRALDHSLTNAICGINPKGKPPHAAAAEISRTIGRILEQRVSGVALRQ